MTKIKTTRIICQNEYLETAITITAKIWLKPGAIFCRDKTSAKLDHIGHYSVDPAATAGNIENFIGVAQVPLGLIGPLLVNGEHAQGEFYVPMATSEGTLIASYNRGARLLRESGGVKVTVVDDAMQRAPVFVFNDAREAREFGTGLSRISQRLLLRPKPLPPLASSAILNSTPQRACATCALTSLPATPRAKIWSARQLLSPANGL